MITDYQRSLMEHTLGGPDPAKWYRNHFVADDGHQDLPDIRKLEKQGMMKAVKAPSFCSSGTLVFIVTEKGKDFLGKHNISNKTLYKKIALGISVENGEKIVSLSDPIKNYQKPTWKVDLDKDECIILAHALLRECGIRVAKPKTNGKQA
jgi:hypothetical protein